MIDYHSPFVAEEYYHIYNRGNNKENIFTSDDNYSYFLSKWQKYIHPYIDTLAYCLMPNHFHFLFKVKSTESFTKLSKFSKAEQESFDLNKLLENQFKRFFTSYALAFNKQQVRTGSLFQKRFKRVLLKNDADIIRLIQYIHHNPIHHGFSSKYEDWKYSSYSAIIENGLTLLDRELVLNLFDGKEQFYLFHQEMKNFEGDIYIDSN